MSGAGPSLLEWLGAVAGAMFAWGVLVVVGRLAARRARLDERVGPYLRVLGTTSALLEESTARPTFPTLDRLVGPWLTEVGRTLERFGSTRPALRRRLDQAGRTESVDQFRAQQVVWAVLGLVGGVLVALLLATTRGSSPVALVALVAFCGLGGFLGCDHLLSRQVARREERMLMEFPTIAELLALSVGAGEGPVAAMERVAAMARGEMSRELSTTLSMVRSGVPLARALEGLADRTSLASLTRFAEGVAVAVERGTPLAEVLRAQAQDVREASRRSLMESGGRKEVLMMIPVVFLILPVTVVFAIFPSITTLQVGL
ncbi:type II secretion system F family protein [Oerskovia douganii]|nr:type II secretion system F family protein [Oerskovia douganii]